MDRAVQRRGSPELAGLGAGPTEALPRSKVGIVRRVGRAQSLPLGLLPIGLLYLALYGAPLLATLATSLGSSTVVRSDDALANYAYLLTRPVFLEAVGRTLAVGLAATALATLLAVPTALALRRLPAGRLAAAIALLALPILVGPLVLALGWLAVLAAGGPLAGLLGALGLPAPRLVGTEQGATIALAYYGLPFVTLVLLAGLLRIDRDLEDAAATDGAGRWAVWRQVTWPLARPALAAGALLVLLLALSAYVAPRFLGGNARPVLTMVIAQYVLATFDRPLAATSAILLLALAAAVALAWPRPPAETLEEVRGREPGVRRGRVGLLVAGWLVLLGLLLLAPLGVTLAGSFSQAALFPAPPSGFSARWYERVLADPQIVAAASLSLWVAAVATGLALLVSLPAALHLARRGPRWLLGPLTAPLAAPQLVLSLALLGLLAALGLPSAPLGLVLAHAAFVTPVVLRALLASLESLDPSLIEAATVDGAGPIRAFLAVVLPLLGGGLLGGAALGFVLSFTNVPLSLFLATPRAMPLPVLMLARLETHLDPGLAALAVLTLLGAVVGSLLAWRAAGPRLWL